MLFRRFRFKKRDRAYYVELAAYLQEWYIPPCGAARCAPAPKRSAAKCAASQKRAEPFFAEPVGAAAPLPDCAKADLAEELERLDESFSEAVLRLIDERGMTDAACYKKAWIDRRHFSKIRNNPSYRPTPATAIALAIALELSLEETQALLMKAGFTLSRSRMFDVIVRYYIENGIYDILTINEALYAYDQPLLGD
ncbi:MAG: hypothetical protein IJU16_02550 [Clostridia bacterium]|nr:hypothetical protein [Clostridia bacterium]